MCIKKPIEWRLHLQYLSISNIHRDVRAAAHVHKHQTTERAPSILLPIHTLHDFGRFALLFDGKAMYKKTATNYRNSLRVLRLYGCLGLLKFWVTQQQNGEEKL